MVPYSTRCLIFINRFWFFGGIRHGAAIPAPCGTWGSPRHVFGFLALGSGCSVFFYSLNDPFVAVGSTRHGRGSSLCASARARVDSLLVVSPGLWRWAADHKHRDRVDHGSMKIYQAPDTLNSTNFCFPLW